MPVYDDMCQRIIPINKIGQQEIFSLDKIRWVKICIHEIMHNTLLPEILLYRW